MKNNIAYFDCFSGISGDMILGALIDLGLKPTFLQKELKKLKLSGYKITIKKITKNKITATDINITINKKNHHHRTLKDITTIIQNSTLNTDIKKTSITIFKKLATAESKIHHTPINSIQFHEVGAIDAIIDITGSVIGIKKLNIHTIFCSPLPMGKGFITTAHGKLPNPAPAAIELLKNTPVYSLDVPYELVTPTGAAIITTYTKHFGPMPLMKLKKIGYGAGKTTMKHPNLLRILLGETKKDYQKTSNFTTKKT